MLTNFKTIQSRINRLKEIEAMEEDGTFDVLPKKEVIELRKKELAKLQKKPGRNQRDEEIFRTLIFIVDPKKERICVQEAHTLGIPLNRYLQIPTVIRKNLIMLSREMMMLSAP
jgi:small subunit ribosomal protein S2